MYGKRLGLCALLLGLASFAGVSTAPAAMRCAPLEGFVEVNGVRLQYLDWGGSGPALILVHGLGDNPYVFDDIAPAFTDRFHVMAYARRGSGGSEIEGPYDVGTLTEDLRGLMDALKIVRADLVGFSAGGDEVTGMAVEHPERVEKIVYFEGGYDETDPDVKPLLAALPAELFNAPQSALRSLDAYRAYKKAMFYGGLDDMGRIEANLREKLVIQQDGTVKERMPKKVGDALFAALVSNKPRDYTRIHLPALAIFADHHYDLNLSDPKVRAAVVAYDEKYWKPFQRKSVERLRRELAHVQVAHVPGAHSTFFLTDRQEVVELMRKFLGEAR